MDKDTGLTAFTFLVLRRIFSLFIFYYFIKGRCQSRAYWSLVFNLLFAPSLHQLSLLSLFAIIGSTKIFILSPLHIRNYLG